MRQDMEQFVLTHFHSAVEKRHIQPYYQPVIRTISKKLCSFEALARWVDPELGVIRPDQFIPVLEREKLIHLLDKCVIQQVCERVRRSMDAGEVPIPVSVNLSRLDFELCDVFQVVDDLVSLNQIPHDFIYIEITEGTIAQHEERMHSFVDRFHAAGYQVWMDDFGSAYSSLNTLKDYTFEELKLDMRFLSSFNLRSRRILTAVVQMAKDINIHTLAEGVETEEQFRYLRNIGCEKVQGYLFGRPLPYEESLDHLGKTGITVETPQERKYYDDIGLVNLLSAVPFMTQDQRDSLTSGRQLNSIPLALVEVDDAYFSLLFHNAAFEETAQGTGLFPDIFAQENMGLPQPITLLAEQVHHLMDASRTEELGKMYFISNEEYYEVQAKCVSQNKERYCVLLRLHNLSKAPGAEQTGYLDESLRQIYSLFERITLINVDADTIEPLYVDTQTDVVSGRTGLRSLSREYAMSRVFPEDREDFLALMDMDTIEERLQQAGQRYVSSCMRSLIGHGQYAWKQYTVLRLQEANYLLLTRNVHEAACSFLSRHQDTLSSAKAAQSISDELLWKSLVSSDIIRLFWKDRERRFLGASQSFLDYYDFQSLSDILGKNDEDLGWHIHVDAYKSDEYQVIHEGRVVRNVPGRCIRNGENRHILANKAPLYDDNGEIQGLVGYFFDRELIDANDSRGGDTRRRDMMTGLLNAQGLLEEEAAYRDEYYLRDVDFVRIHITIDDFASLVQHHGYEFGDKAMVALGRVLKQKLGQTSAVARYSGQRFVVLRQIEGSEEPRELRSDIKAAAASIRTIEGVPVTLYISVGYSVFSEVEDLEEQRQRAENSLLVDHDENISIESRISHASELFHLYDNLPIPFAVFRVDTSGEGVVTDATLFYVNHIYQHNSGLTTAELLGHKTRELFPFMDENWYDAAARAAIGRENVVTQFYFGVNRSLYHITASPVIHTGYCAFTFLILDLQQEEGKSGASSSTDAAVPENGVI